jgi:hypothetical protein
MRFSQLTKKRVLITIVFREGLRMGVASMVAGAQATAMAAGRRVQARTSPPWLIDHAGISDDRCRALRGGQWWRGPVAHSAHLESKIGSQKRGKQICPWFHGGYGVEMKMKLVPVYKAIYGSQFLTLS